MQKIETKKVPSYKWVVEDLCAKCESKTESAAVEPDAQILAATVATPGSAGGRAVDCSDMERESPADAEARV